MQGNADVVEGLQQRALGADLRHQIPARQDWDIFKSGLRRLLRVQAPSPEGGSGACKRKQVTKLGLLPGFTGAARASFNGDDFSQRGEFVGSPAADKTS